MKKLASKVSENLKNGTSKMLTDEQILLELGHARMLLTTNDFMGTRLVDPGAGAVACIENVLKSLQEKFAESK